jgi:hypothetical protein
MDSSSSIKTWVINAVLLVFSSLVAVALVECFLWLTHWTVPARVDVFAMNGVTLPSWPEFVRFVPYVKTVGVSSTAEYEIHYKINDTGLRDSVYPTHKPRGLRRILFVGDSVTEGMGVEQGQAYPEIIEAQGAGLECINAGIRGTSPSDFCFRIPKLQDQYRDADMVVVQLFDNDFWDDGRYTSRLQIQWDEASQTYQRLPFAQSHEYLKPFGPMAVLLSSSRLAWLIGAAFVPVPGQEPWDYTYPKETADGIAAVFEEAEIAIRREAVGEEKTKVVFPHCSPTVLSAEGVDALWQFCRTALYEDFALADEEKAVLYHAHASRKEYEQTLRYLAYCHRLCQAKQQAFRLVYIPSQQGLRYQTDEFLAAWCEEQGIAFFAATRVLRPVALESGRAVYYPLDGHLTVLGHRLVADALGPWLCETGE